MAEASTPDMLAPPVNEQAVVQLYHVAHGGVVVCALAGALFYLASSDLPSNRQKLIYTFVSFVFGCFSAPLIADFLAVSIQKIAGLTMQANLELGALLGAACCVRAMQFVSDYLANWRARRKEPQT
ncbi:hypothetical protein JCM19000A_07390 [Silvimonas sp. JCM 19000]